MFDTRIPDEDPIGDLERYASDYKETAQDSIIKNHHTNKLAKCTMVPQETIDTVIDNYIRATDNLLASDMGMIWEILGKINSSYDFDAMTEAELAALVDFFNYIVPKEGYLEKKETSDYVFRHNLQNTYE